MHIVEYKNQMQEVVQTLEGRLRRTSNQRRRQQYGDRARKQILRIAKEARNKLDRSKIGLEAKWYGDFTLRWGPHDRSKLPKKLENATEEALARIAHLVSKGA